MVSKMVKLSKKIIEMFNNEYCDKNKPLIWVATTDNEGNPHLAPICFSKVINKNKILISINFAKKTLGNIENGSKVAVASAIYYDGYLVKGSASVIKEGKYFDEVKSMVKERFGEKIKPQAAILVDVEEVYSLKPKPGKKKIKL